MKRILGNWLGGIISGILFLVGISVACAQSGNPINLTNPLGSSATVPSVITSIGAFLLALAVPLTGIMVIVGAFQMITAAGDPTKFSNGRKTLVYAAVGFAIVLFASSVVPVIKSILGG